MDKWEEWRRKETLAAAVIGLKPTTRQLPQKGLQIDHFSVWTRGRDLVVWDDPFIPSLALENEEAMRRGGWRIRHLPTSMSLYIAGKCQPRLLAPPGSKADIDHLAELLQLAKFRGCFALTEKFYETDADVCAVRQRLAAEGI